MNNLARSEEPVPLTSLLEPTSVAILGASAKEGSFGRRLMENLVGAGYTGEVFPVSRSATELEGRHCYGSLAELPQAAECVMVAVPGPAVVAAVEEAAASGARAVVVVSSGFAELGPAGEQAQRRLAEIARHHDVALLGPNCIGVVNFWDRVALTFLPGIGRMTQSMAHEPGLAVVSQSGALGSYLIQAYLRGVTFSYLFSAGNSPLVDVGDAMVHLAAKPEVTAFCLLFEGLRPGSPLLDGLEAARRAGKPVVAVKAGSSTAGAVAAISHTASRVGDDATCRAALVARGALVMEGHDQLIEAAGGLAKTVGRPRRSDGILVVTGSGGAGVLACDAAERHGVRLSVLSDETKDRLTEVLPPYAQAANPLDITATLSSKGGLRTVLDVSAADPDVGTLVVLLGMSLHGETGGERASDVVATSETQDIPGAVVWMGEDFSGPPVVEVERSKCVAMYKSTELCLRVLAHGDRLRHHYFGARPEVVPPVVEWPAVERALAAASAGPDGLLDEPSSLAVLDALGIPTVRGVRCDDLDDLEELARTWSSYPAVVKVVSAAIAHKAAAGGVEVGVLDASGMVAAGHRIDDRVRASLAGPVEGFLVEPQVSGVRELLLGAYRDPLYGPVVVVGQGGGGVDQRRAVVVAAVPVSDDDAREALARSAVTGDLLPEVAAQMAGVMTRLGALMERHPAIGEVDVNPLVLEGGGSRVTAVDGLVRLASGER